MHSLWTVCALTLGHHRIQKSDLTHFTDPGMSLDVPILAVALSDGAHKILVDTGHHDADWLSEHLLPATTAPQEELEQALKQGPGWTPDEVDLVINTHLHFDHCGKNALFRRAKFIASKAEWEFGFSPQAHQAANYMPALYDTRAVNPFSWEFVDEDARLYSGLSVLMTPGHSPGHLSVLVNTDEGVLCVAGDACPTVQNLNENILSTINTSPEQMLQSYRRIRRHADRVIPGHEVGIRPYQSEGFPVVDKRYDF